MAAALQIPQSLYDQAERAARSRGLSLAAFVAQVLEEKLHSVQQAGGNRQRVRLPLVPSAHPGTRQITGEQVAELTGEDDVPCRR